MVRRKPKHRLRYHTDERLAFNILRDTIAVFDLPTMLKCGDEAADACRL